MALFEGVEECCLVGDGKPFMKVRKERGRGYKLELHSNVAGHFLLCFVCSMEENVSPWCSQKAGDF